MGLFRKDPAARPLRNPKPVDESSALTFRRSRTLTGSASEHVRTASEPRAQLKSPRLKEHELRAHRRRLGLTLAGVCAIIIALVGLLSQFIGSISITVQSSQPLTRQVQESGYERVLNTYFAARPFERFRFALNETALTRHLERHAPEIAEVTFDQTGLGAAAANIRFREPVVTWQLRASRAYVDREGFAFTTNYYRDPALSVKDDSGIEAASGAIVSDRFLRFMGRVIALTNESGVVTVSGVIIPRGTAREIDFTLEGRGYFVKTQLGRDPASQAADIVNAVRYIDAKGYTPQYVDVRVAGRAAYR